MFLNEFSDIDVLLVFTDGYFVAIIDGKDTVSLTVKVRGMRIREMFGLFKMVLPGLTVSCVSKIVTLELHVISAQVICVWIVMPIYLR